MRTYLDLFDIGVVVFVVSLLGFSISLIIYGFYLMWRLMHDGPQADEPTYEAHYNQVEYVEAHAAYDVIEEAELIVEQYQLGKEHDNV